MIRGSMMNDLDNETRISILFDFNSISVIVFI